MTGLTVPAGGSAVLIYEATATPVAPLATGSSITNTATITGGGLTTPITAQATVETANSADLTISKALSPTTVTENGQITYTFVISNTGNTEATATGNVVVTDTFAPILRNIPSPTTARHGRRAQTTPTTPRPAFSQRWPDRSPFRRPRSRRTQMGRSP